MNERSNNTQDTRGLTPEMIANKWTKGQCPNPKGRPKGSKNRSTVLKELFEQVIDGEDLSGNRKALPVETHIIQALVRKAITGDVSAIKESLDTVYGKVADVQELTGKDGGAIEIMSTSDEAVLEHFIKTKGAKYGQSVHKEDERAEGDGV